MSLVELIVELLTVCLVAVLCMCTCVPMLALLGMGIAGAWSMSLT